VANSPSQQPALTNLRSAFVEETITRKKSASRTWTTVLSTLCLILFVLGVLKSVATPTKAIAPRIVVSDRAIPAGCRITYDSLHYREVQQHTLSKNMITDSDSIAGRVAKNFIAAGDPIFESDLLANGQSVSEQLSSGLRAVGFTLTPDALVNYEVHPRDRVDIIVTANKDGKQYTRTICQDILVLSATPKEGMLVDKPNQAEANRVTLAATTHQAEILSEAAETGKLRLAIRNPEDHRASDAAGANEKDVYPSDLFSQKSVSASLVKPPPPPALPTLAMSMPMPIPEQTPSETPSAQAPHHGWIVELFKGANREEQEVGTSTTVQQEPNNPVPQQLQQGSNGASGMQHAFGGPAAIDRAFGRSTSMEQRFVLH
jgi:Flp pilus assembly protein CpaB